MAKHNFEKELNYYIDMSETDQSGVGTKYLARLFKANGLGVVPSKPRRYDKPGMESIVASVANMISEDINFDPMTPRQKRIKQIAESYGYSVYLLTENTIAEGVDREILAQWLDHAGITIDSIKGKFQDIDYRRLDMVITKIEDGETIVIQDHHDLSPDDLHRALSFIQREDTNSPIESTQYETEELARDASLLITAYKIIDNVPYGLAFYSLDDPREPRYDDPDDFDGLSDSDLFGDEDELTRMWDRG